MEYVYMQKPRPMDAIGVPITISVVDANGNYRDIGTTISDADGFYSLNWKPDIEGKYTVYASFGGSESYWPSHAVSAFAVDPAAATPAPTEQPIQSASDMYFVPAIAGLFVYNHCSSYCTGFVDAKKTTIKDNSKHKTIFPLF